MLGQSITINKKHSNLNYISQHGHFFFFNPKTHNCTCARDCREMFAWEFRKNKTHVGFFSSCVNIEKFNEFWEIIENKLNLAQKSIIHPLENFNQAFVIELSPFWLENTTRRSLLTLLIRCGANYYYGDYTFDEALNEYYLAKETTPAIKHFLEGNTKPTYTKFGYGGWYSKFVHLKKDDVGQYLVKPI